MFLEWQNISSQNEHSEKRFGIQKGIEISKISQVSFFVRPNFSGNFEFWYSMRHKFNNRYVEYYVIFKVSEKRTTPISDKGQGTSEKCTSINTKCILKNRQSQTTHNIYRNDQFHMSICICSNFGNISLNLAPQKDYQSNFSYSPSNLNVNIGKE